MVNLRPGLTSYARVSYLRELHGDLPGAIAAMRDAATIAQSLGESGSWARVQLGHLLLQTGDISGAEQEYHRALAVNPTDMLAEGGLGRARMAAGDFSGAIPHFERAFKGLPLPEFVLALGDLYEATGRPDDAARQFDLARALQQLFIAGGGNADMELALLEAERGDPTQAVDIARGEVARRQSVHAYDVLSWALYQAGDLTGAHAASQQALRLGSQDGLMLFHAGMIDARRGDRAAAIAELTKALARQPGGYAPRGYAPQADAALQQLGAAR